MKIREKQIFNNDWCLVANNFLSYEVDLWAVLSS